MLPVQVEEWGSICKTFLARKFFFFFFLISLLFFTCIALRYVVDSNIVVTEMLWYLFSLTQNVGACFVGDNV